MVFRLLLRDDDSLVDARPAHVLGEFRVEGLEFRVQGLGFRV